MLFVIVGITIAVVGTLSLVLTLLFSLLGNSLGGLLQISNSYAANSDMIALSAALFAVGTPAVLRQQDIMNVIGQAYECTFYDFAYRATNDDLGGPAYLILAQQFYDWFEPKWNAVVDYFIAGLEDAADAILGVSPVDPLNFTDVWTAICAIFDFLIHVIRTPHSGDTSGGFAPGVEEIEIPDLTDPVLDFLIDMVTCWLGFIKDFIRALAASFFLGSCSPECDTLSERACNCTKLTVSVIGFAPSNGGIFRPYVEGLADVACCTFDLGVAAANTLANGTFLAYCPQLIEDTGECAKLYLDVATGGPYTGQFLKPVTDGFVDVGVCWAQTLKQTALNIMNALVFGSPTFDSTLDDYVDASMNCTCQFIDFATGGTVLGTFSDAVDGLCDVLKCNAQWTLKLFRSFRDATFVVNSVDLLNEWWDCFLLFLNWLFSSVNQINFFEPFARAIVAVGREFSLLVYNLVRFSLLSGTLGSDFPTRIAEFVSFFATFLRNLTGGGEFIDFTFTPFVNGLSSIFGGFLQLLADVLVSVTGGTFTADVFTLISDYFVVLADFLVLITDNAYPQGTPAFVVLARCAANAVVWNWEQKDPDITGAFQAHVFFLDQLCGCLGAYVDEVFRFDPGNVSAWGVVVGDFLDCWCVTLRNLMVEIQQVTGRILQWDCYFCAHPSVPFGNCSPPPSFGIPGTCRTYSLDLWSCLCELLKGIMDSGVPGFLFSFDVGEALEDSCLTFVCFFELYKPMLGSVISVLDGDPVEAANQFTVWLDGVFSCFDNLFDVASGGTVTDFFLFLLELLGGELLTDFVKIVACFNDPTWVSSWRRPIFDFATLPGAPAPPVIGAQTPCGIRRILNSRIDCLRDPTISLLSPLTDHPELDLLSPTNGALTGNNPILSYFAAFDSVLECFCDMAFLFATGFLSCDASCFTCAGGISLGDPIFDWSNNVFLGIESVLSFLSVGDIIDLSDLLPIGAVTNIPNPLGIICCLPQLFTCLSAMELDDQFPFNDNLPNPFAFFGTIIQDAFDAFIDAMCAFITLFRFILKLFEAVFDLFGIFNLGPLQELLDLLTDFANLLASFNLLEAAFNLLLSNFNILSDAFDIISDLVNTLNDIVGTLQAGQALLTNLLVGDNGIMEAIDELCEAFSGLDASLDIPGVISIGFPSIDLCGTEFTAFGRRRNVFEDEGIPIYPIMEACSFYNASTPNVTLGELVPLNSTLRADLDRCLCTQVGIPISNDTMTPVSNETLDAIVPGISDFRLCSAHDASSYLAECVSMIANYTMNYTYTGPDNMTAGDSNKTVNLRTVAECAWGKALEATEVFQYDDPPARCTRLLYTGGPARMMFLDTMNPLEYRTFAAYWSCWQTVVYEEASRKAKPERPAKPVQESMDLVTSTLVVQTVQATLNRLNTSGLMNVSEWHLNLTQFKTWNSSIKLVNNTALHAVQQRRKKRDAAEQKAKEENERRREEYLQWKEQLKEHYANKWKQQAEENRRKAKIWEEIRQDPSAYRKHFPKRDAPPDNSTLTGLLYQLPDNATDTQKMQVIAGYIQSELQHRWANSKTRWAQSCNQSRVNLNNTRQFAAELRANLTAELEDMKAKMNQTHSMQSLQVRMSTSAKEEFVFPHEHRPSIVLPSYHLDAIYEWSNFSRAAEEGRVYWMEDETGHYGYSVLQPNNTMVPSPHLRAASHAMVLSHRKRDYNPQQQEWMGSLTEEWVQRNMSDHLDTVSQFMWNASQVRWGEYLSNRFRIFRLFAQGYDVSKRTSSSSIFGFPVDKQMWRMRARRVMGAGNEVERLIRKEQNKLRRERRVVEEGIRELTPFVSSAIDPEGANDKSFNENSWLFARFDEVASLFGASSSTAFTDFLDDLANEPVEDNILDVVDVLIDYLVCNRPEDYNGTNPYKATCAPNIPRGALDFIKVVPNEQITVQTPWPVGLIANGSCVQGNFTRPGDACAASDGGDRPLCPVCHHCRQTFKECRAEIGFEGVSDSLAFSLAAFPRFLNIILHPRQELGLLGDPSVSITISFFFPTYGQILLYAVVGSSIAVLPLLNLVLPGAWKVTTALFASTLFFTYPVFEFSAISVAQDLVDVTEGLFFFVPANWFDFVKVTLARFDYPEPWADIPAEDTICFLWTLGYTVAPWALIAGLFGPLIGPLSNILLTILLAVGNWFSLMLSAFNLIFTGKANLDNSRTKQLSLGNQQRGRSNARRLDALEQQTAPPTLSPPPRPQAGESRIYSSSYPPPPPPRITQPTRRKVHLG